MNISNKTRGGWQCVNITPTIFTMYFLLFFLPSLSIFRNLRFHIKKKDSGLHLCNIASDPKWWRSVLHAQLSKQTMAAVSRLNWGCEGSDGSGRNGNTAKKTILTVPDQSERVEGAWRTMIEYIGFGVVHGSQLFAYSFRFYLHILLCQ